MHSLVFLTTLALTFTTNPALALPRAEAAPEAQQSYNNGQNSQPQTYPTGNGGGPASYPGGPASYPGGPASYPGGPASYPGGPATYPQTSVAAPAVSAAPSSAAAPAGYGSGGWQQSVTWPVGCESWANPCPPGAHISGGGVAGGAGGAGGSGSSSGYTNGFTSYTSMTNSDGVITGMPSKATVAAGVSTTGPAKVDSTLSTVTGSAAANATVSTPTGSAGTSATGFSVATTSAKPTFTGAAPRPTMVGGRAVALLGAAGFAIAML